MAFSELYPSLHDASLTSSILLAVPEDSDKEADIGALSITNKIVIELYHFMNRNSGCTYYTLWRWLASLFGDLVLRVKF